METGTCLLMKNATGMRTRKALTDRYGKGIVKESMYHEFSERMMAVFLQLALLLPYLITQLLVAGAEDRQKKKHPKLLWLVVLIINLCLNSAVLLAALTRLTGASEPLKYFAEIGKGEWAYRDFWPLTEVLALSLCFAAAAGLVLRIVLYRADWLNIPRKGLQKLMIVGSIGISVLMLGSSLSLQSAGHFKITEVCRKTGAIVTSLGRDRQHDPVRHTETCYITLANDGIFSCGSERLYFSDDEEHLQKYPVAGFLILPGETRTVAAEYNHLVDFRMDGPTEVYLSDEQGVLLDHVTVPMLEEEESYILSDAQDGGWQILRDERENGQAEVGVPVFSCEGGFYDRPFDLLLSAGEGTSIYYTLDGSIPDMNSLRYEGPIHVTNRSGEPNKYRSIPNVMTDYLHKLDQIPADPVDKAFIVRAVAADSKGNFSGVVTQTYFVDLNKYRDHDVISLAVEPEDFFGDEGIYVTGPEYDSWYEDNLDWLEDYPRTEYLWLWQENEPEPNFKKRGDIWEKPVHVEILRGERILSQNAGIKISGSSTRSTALKRFSLYARKAYSGNNLFDAPVFGEKNLHSFALRSGFPNALIPLLTEDRDIAVLQSFPAAVFLNGEFWGETFLSEKYHESYFAETYGVKENNVKYLKMGRFSRLSQADQDLYNSEFPDFLSGLDLSDPAAYEAFCRKVDIQSYIDFQCINLYVNNEDMCDTLNLLLWRVNEPEGDGVKDGRWRWGLYDMDLRWEEMARTQGVAHHYQINTFTTPNNHFATDNTYVEQPIFRALFKNPDFRKQFVLTFMDLVNTDFRPETVLEKMAAWGVTEGEYADFFAFRPEYIVPYMAEVFGLMGTQETVTLSVNDPAAGRVSLNTVTPDLSRGPWKGSYYTDYPVTLTAKAEDGYRFAGWVINGLARADAETETDVTAGGLEIQAVFEKR